MKPQKVEISNKTIVFTVFFLLSLFFLWQIKDLIFALIIALIIAGGLEKPIVFLKKNLKIPHIIAVIFVYLLFLFFFFNLIYFFIPPILKEVVGFSTNFPKLLNLVFPKETVFFDINILNQNLPQLTNDLFNLIKNIFSNIVFILSILSFSFYFLIEEDFFLKSLKKFFDDYQAEKINHIIKKIQRKVSFWLWGELFLMFAVGGLTYLGLLFLGVHYPLPLSILAGLLEIIPNLGPTIAAIPAIIVGASQNLNLGFGALILAIIVQQLENNFLVPLVMRQFVGLNPVTTLISLIIGGKIAGIMGVILAVPFVLIIEEILIEILKRK